MSITASTIEDSYVGGRLAYPNQTWALSGDGTVQGKKIFDIFLRIRPYCLVNLENKFSFCY